MYTLHKRTWTAAGTAVLGVAILATVTGNPLVAGEKQEPEIPVRLNFKYDLAQSREDVSKRTDNIVLVRPNTQQSVYLFAENTGEFGLKNLIVKLLQVHSNDSTSVVEQAILNLDGSDKPGSFKQIVFSPKKEPKKEDKKPEVGAKLAGPPFEMQIWFEQAGKKTKKLMLPIRVMEPNEYVDVPAAKATYNKAAKTVSVAVEKSKQIFGTPSIVLLELQQEFIPNLKPIKTAGVYKQVLLPYPSDPAKAREVELRATALQFNDDLGLPKDGRVYLTVDGNDRAIGFSNSANDGTLRRLDNLRMRILAPRYFIPGKKMPVTMQVDNFRASGIAQRAQVTDPRQKPSRIVLAWELDESGSALPIATLDGHRQQTVAFNPAGPDGALVLENTVRDWAVEIDTSDLFGAKVLRATLENKDGDAETLVDESKSDPILLFQPTSTMSKYAPLSYKSDVDRVATAVRATVVLDSTAPLIRLAYELENKTEFVRGNLLTVKADVIPQAPLSPIKDVVFFVGKPTAKKTMPEDAVKAIDVRLLTKDWQPTQPSTWVATLPIDTKKPGIHFVSVQATNQAGHVEYKTIKLVLVDGGNGGGNGKNKLAKVVGTVKTGDLLQAGVSVFLADEKGVVKGFAKTGDKPRGGFVIEKVKPGTYKVIASNPALKLTGETFVTVPEGVGVVQVGAIQLKR